jgi:hypothetical protein
MKHLLSAISIALIILCIVIYILGKKYGPEAIGMKVLLLVIAILGLIQVYILLFRV